MLKPFLRILATFRPLCVKKRIVPIPMNFTREEIFATPISFFTGKCFH